MRTKAGDDTCDGTIYSQCGRSRSDKNACLLYGHNDGRNGLFLAGYSGWLQLRIPDVRNGRIVVKLETWHRADEMPQYVQSWTSINGNNNDDGIENGDNYYNNRNLLKIETNTSTTTPSSTTTTTFSRRLRNTNQRIRRNNNNRRRNLKAQPIPYCSEFRFEYSINGQLTSLDLEQFQKRNAHIQRVVETIVLLNNKKKKDDDDHTDASSSSDFWVDDGGQKQKQQGHQVDLAMRLVGCGNDKLFSISHLYWS